MHKCKIYHEKPLGEGKFEIYGEGKFYSVENPDPKYWEIPAEPQTKTTLETEKKEKNKSKGGYER